MEITTAPIAGTAAEQAVNHLLQRVAQDRNLSWHMMLTESLRLCLIAEAERTGKDVGTVEAELHAAMDAAEPRLKRHKAHVAEVSVLDQRLDQLERMLAELNDRGDLPEDDYAKLREVMETHPDNWEGDHE